jgi:hypothetical protein
VAADVQIRSERNGQLCVHQYDNGYFCAKLLVQTRPSCTALYLQCHTRLLSCGNRAASQAGLLSMSGAVYATEERSLYDSCSCWDFERMRAGKAHWNRSEAYMTLCFQAKRDVFGLGEL